MFTRNRELPQKVNDLLVLIGQFVFLLLAVLGKDPQSHIG